MLIFKICGLLIILGSSSVLGLYKGLLLKKRTEKLKNICFSLEKLSQLVKSGAGETKQLFSMSFEKNILTFKGDIVVFSEDYLNDEDVKLFNDFLSEAGLWDSETEIRRIEIFKSLFQSNAQKAQKKSDELSKLYNS